MHMNKKIVYFALAIALGAWLFIYGGNDDSPGAQLLGLIIVIVGIVGVIKNRKKH